MTVYEGRVFKEVIKVKMRILEQALIQYDWYPYKKGKLGQTHRGKTMWRHREMATYKARIKALEETNLAGTLLLDFCTPELCENKLTLLKPPSLWYL